jgi:hypothetical protein
VDANDAIVDQRLDAKEEVWYYGWNWLQYLIWPNSALEIEMLPDFCCIFPLYRRYQSKIHHLRILQPFRIERMHRFDGSDATPFHSGALQCTASQRCESLLLCLELEVSHHIYSLAMSDPASSAASAVFTQMQQNTMDPSLLPPPITSSGLSNVFSKNHGSTTEQSHEGNQIGESNASEPVQIDNSMNPYISLPFSELESILSRLTEST